MRKTGYLVLAALIVAACNNSVEQTDFKSLKNSVWNREDVLQFTYDNTDTLQPHHIYINVRNDNTYPFSNLFLIAAITDPQGEVVQDTLEYAMALPDGTWLGKGAGSIKENKLWYKEDIVFSTMGVYTIEVSHAMRKNGNLSGIEGLQGITDVGVEIDKSNP